ncbi:MAG: hypothetical protein EBS97_05940, partial [Verrucomicrobia bacterium]|nr:hypothetical protein [Verrucomicrobiota bacterium]
GMEAGGRSLHMARSADAEAPLPPPPLIVMVGAVVYPVPAFVKTMAETLPPEIVASAVAKVPPPPLILTRGP